jgi:malate dehydrogenase
VRDWALGTADGDWVSMAVVSDGSYGVPEASSPRSRHVRRWELGDRAGLEIDDFSRARIDASAAELADERDAVRELGLI